MTPSTLEPLAGLTRGAPRAFARSRAAAPRRGLPRRERLRAVVGASGERDRSGRRLELAGAPLHAAYPTALRTLCGLPTADLIGPRGPTRRPTCRRCLEAAQAFDQVDSSAPRTWFRPVRTCIGITHKGERCKREPLPRLLYCSWHQHLEAAA